MEKSLFIYARVFGNSISIPQQTIEDHTIEGSGTISSSTITLEFTDDLYGGVPWNATATLTRR